MRKNSYLLSIIMTLLFIWIFIPVAHAGNEQLYQVDADHLNARTAPNQDAKVVGQLMKGNQVTVFQKKYGWLQTYLDGKEVWVASQYLYKMDGDETTEQVSNEADQDITITGDVVHIRTGPGTDHSVAEVAVQGDSYSLLDTKNDWHQVKLANNEKAWVASWVTDQPTTNKKTTNKATVKASKQTTPENKNKPSKKKESTTTNSNGQSLSGYNIMLDASHGGKDPGSISMNGEKEKDFALKLTQKVAEKLKSEGAKVLLTRPNDAFISLEERVKYSSNYWTHAFISLHFNAFTSSESNGISTHYYSGQKDLQLAQYIQQALTNHTSLQDRGVRQDNYYVLRENNATSVLAELGFITNPDDLQTIQSEEYASQVAEAISEGLKNYFHQ